MNEVTITTWNYRVLPYTDTDDQAASRRSCPCGAAAACYLAWGEMPVPANLNKMTTRMKPMCRPCAVRALSEARAKEVAA